MKYSKFQNKINNKNVNNQFCLLCDCNIAYLEGFVKIK